MMVTVTSQLEFVIDSDQVEVVEVVWSQQYSIPITGVLWPPPERIPMRQFCSVWGELTGSVIKAQGADRSQSY